MPEEVTKIKHANVRLATFILLIILVAIAFGGAGYLYGIDAGKTLTAVTPTATVSATTSKTAVSSATSTADVTANWKTYANDKYGYSFKYPDGWNYEASGDGSIGFSEIGKKYEVEGASVAPLYEKLELNGASDSTAIEIATARKLKTDIGTPTLKSYTMSGFDAARGSDYIQTVTYVKLSNGNLFTLGLVNNGVQKDQDRLITICDQILSTFQFTK